MTGMPRPLRRRCTSGRGLGSIGPLHAYDGLEALDVTDHFGLWVHAEYKRRFPYFVRGLDSARTCGVSAGSGDTGSTPDRPS